MGELRVWLYKQPPENLLLIGALLVIVVFGPFVRRAWINREANRP